MEVKYAYEKYDQFSVRQSFIKGLGTRLFSTVDPQPKVNLE